MQEAGPAIFAIDEAKNECHGTNSIVDCITKTAAPVLRADFVGREIDVVGAGKWFPQACFKQGPRGFNPPNTKNDALHLSNTVL